MNRAHCTAAGFLAGLLVGVVYAALWCDQKEPPVVPDPCPMRALR